MPIPQAPNSATAELVAGTWTVSWLPPAVAGTSYEVTAIDTVQGTRVRYTRPQSPLPLADLPPGKYTFEVRAVVSGEKSAATTSNGIEVLRAPVSGLWATLSLVFVGAWAAAAAIFLVLVGATSKHDHIYESLALASATLFLGLLLTALAGGAYGVWRPIVGFDQRLSTSRTQIALWTLLLAFALVFFTGRTWFGNEPHLFEGFTPTSTTTTTTLPAAATTHGATPSAGATDTSSTSSGNTTVWDQYLLLLGGPFAALVLARGIISSKVNNGSVQKTVADDGSANVLQLLQDDDGNTDLVDTQYLLFNLVAFAYVVVALAKTDRLPDIPAILLALTGSSAAAYVLNKSIDQSAPTITAITPGSARPGDRVVVNGMNFAPAGSTLPAAVTVDGTNAVVDAGATDSTLTFVVPAGLRTGVANVIVVTGANASTAPVAMQVLDDKPVITSILPLAAVVPANVDIDGWFLTDIDTINSVEVRFEETAAPGNTITQPGTVVRTARSLQRITVPTNGLAAGASVTVTVRTPRGTASDGFPYRLGP